MSRQKSRLALWVELDPDTEGSCQNPDFERHWHYWFNNNAGFKFTDYWNKNVRYPRIKFYEHRDQWRLYFDTELDRIAWALGYSFTEPAE